MDTKKILGLLAEAEGLREIQKLLREGKVTLKEILDLVEDQEERDELFWILGIGA